MRWKTTEPPKRNHKLIKLRYQDSRGRIRQGEFYWDNGERTWLESSEDPDGIGLYESDGYKVLGWKEVKA